jgi:galactonate dehydratase
MYAHCHGETIDEAVELAILRKSQGFTAIKIALDAPVQIVDNFTYVEKQEARLSAIRDAVGKEMDIAIDFHGRVSPAMAIRLAKAFEPYYPMFIEEPCLPENVDAMVRVANSTTIPIATGERLFTKWGFREVLEKQAVAIVQPDLCHAGGIFEARKIAAMAETYYGAVAPHNPLGPISLAACLQLDACTPNFLIQEHPTLDDKGDIGNGFLKTPFKIEGGYISIPKGPGLGIELDEEALQEKIFEGKWETPRLYHEDGSVADW